MPNEAANSDGDSPNYISTGGKKWITCMILLLVNLLNYMDRYTIVGVMDHLKVHFDMTDSETGMLQTVFISSYMVFAPLFGYLGDRYNRKLLMITGICVWISAVFMSSWCTQNHFILFLVCRGIVGIGEASYSTLAPTIISDLFHGGQRSRVLMLFYFAIPFGSGLGFIAGSRIALITGSWQWGVRFSPIIGIMCLVLMIFLLEEPVRGACEGARQNSDDGTIMDDIKYLSSIPTYYLGTIASIASFFSIGAMTWWTPQFVGYGYALINNQKIVPEDESASIKTIFGVITCVAGIVGVAGGSMISRCWRDGTFIFKHHASEKADVYICAISMFAALPFLFFAIFSAQYSDKICLLLLYFAIMFMCLNWAVNVDVLMYVIVANRRATAMAIQTLITHLFGDATSPYIIGLLSDWIRGDGNEGVTAHFFALQKSLYVPTFMLVIAGTFYLIATFYVENDRKEALFQMDAPDTFDRHNPEDMDELLPSGEIPEEVEGVVEHPATIVPTSATSTTNSDPSA
uniref:MFS domain-containing protein n=5 Tax=Caenorhabditis japonica TaxID=281687 RepID=A0A8R1DI30_CAEJA